MKQVKNKFSKRLSVFLAALMLFSMLPGSMVKASAAESAVTLDIGNGSIVITDSGYSVGGGEPVSCQGSYKITQNDNTHSTGNTITVQSGTHDIILNGVNIQAGSSSGAAFTIVPGAAVNLTLQGSSKLQSGTGHAGLEALGDSDHPSDPTRNASVTISGTEMDSLTAVGGRNAAGIGGSYQDGSNINHSAGTINICSGTITATGGDYGGAGIGGGYNGTGGTITISGGKVSASSVSNGSGIGGGYESGGGTITIVGGDVTANGGSWSAGIGGSWMADGGIINISGGKVTATGNTGAGIGGGFKASGGTITLSGGTVIATGGNEGAGIGGSSYGSGGTINVSGGNITANGTGGGAGIGGGGGTATNGSQIGITGGNGGDITISGGQVTATGGNGGTGLGGGAWGGNGSHVTISGAGTVVNALGDRGAWDIGGSGGDGGSLTVGDDTTTLGSLPTLNLKSTGINAPATFKNCVINNSASSEMTGTYNAEKYIPVNVGLTATPVSDSKISMQASVSKANDSDTYDGTGTVKFSYSSDGGAFNAVDDHGSSASAGSPATAEFTPDSGRTCTVKAEYSSAHGYRKGSASTDISTPGADASLSGLAVTTGKLSPDFSFDTKDYTVNVGRETGSIQLTPTANEPHAMITVNSSAVASGALSNDITLGDAGSDTKISIVVTAQNGNKETYNVKVHRAAETVSAVTVSYVSGGTVVTDKSITTYSTGIDGNNPIILKADVQPSDAMQGVRWSVNKSVPLINPGSGTVTENPDGTVTFKGTKAGSVSVSAEAADGSGKCDTFNIKVTTDKSIVITGSSSVAVGDTLLLTANLTNVTLADVKWTNNAESQNQPSDMGKGSGTLTDNKNGTASFKAETAGYNYVQASGDGVSSEPFLIRIGVAPTITASSLPIGTAGTAYSQALTADGDAAIAWALTSGSLPDGLILSPNGTVSGTPTKDGDFSFTVQASNDYGNDTKQVSLHINTADSGKTYGIDLNHAGPDPYIFDPLTEDYDNSSVYGLMVGVWNTGNQPTGDLTAALSGTGKGCFSLTMTDVGSIDVGKMNGFTIEPVLNLAAGTYTATLTVSGGNVAQKSFDVSITVKAAPISTEKAITSFSIGGHAGTINEKDHTIKVTVPGGIDVTKLAPTVTVSKKATVSPTSGTVQDFTKPVTYTVTAQDNTTQDYTVTVTVDPSLTWGISLSQTGTYAFPTQAAGYSPMIPLYVTVRNTGNQPTGALSITLSGTGKASFGGPPASIDSISAGGSFQFFILPNLSLPKGVYTATVTVSGDCVTPQSFELSFTVNDGGDSDCGIALSQVEQYAFTPQTVGYGSLTPLNVTVKNTGSKPTGDLSISLSDMNSDCFTLSKATIGGISVGGTDSFSIVPNAGLPAGFYVTLVTVFGDAVTPQSFKAIFPVSAGGGSSSGGSSGTAYQAATKDSNGSSANLTITTNGGSAAVSMGTAQESVLKSGGKLAVSMPKLPDASSYGVKIPAGSLSANGGGTLTMNTALGNIAVPTDMLSSLPGASGQTAQITISQGNRSALSDDLQKKIGDKPIVQLTLSLGGTQTEWSNPGAPVTVSVPYTPTAKEKANPDAIVIWYIDGGGNAVCIPSGHYDAATGNVTFQTTHFSQYTVGYNNVSFSDVTGGAWYKDYVNYLAARDIVGGTGSGQFSPDASVTRAQFVTILARMSGDNLGGCTSSAFSDVSAGEWYFAAAQWANKSGIAAGSDGKFCPDAKITREEMATMLFRYAKYKDYNVSNTEKTSGNEFSDYDSISVWAEEPVQWAVNKKIISGNDDGSFAPQQDATRAEAAKIISALVQETAK